MRDYHRNIREAEMDSANVLGDAVGRRRVGVGGPAERVLWDLLSETEIEMLLDAGGVAGVPRRVLNRHRVATAGRDVRRLAAERGAA